MAKRQAVIFCSRCEAPFRQQTPFCAECGGPTPWATHEDRVAWEVRQWRSSRAREPERATPMMLVRTEEGYQPAPIDPRTQYVWDQPLHPEREKQQSPANGHANGNGSNGHGPHGHTPAVPSSVATHPEPAPEPVHGPPPVSAPQPASAPQPVSAHVPPAPQAGDDTVSISKKAVAVAIVLAVGLPLGGRALNIVGSEPEAARRPATEAGVSAPVPVAAARSGFVQVSGDAVRYAVLVRNPNKAHAAHAVIVSISLLNARGRLVGTDTERLPVVSAGSTTAIAGTTDADGRVARLAVRVTSDGFLESRGRPFVVRSVRLARSGSNLVVRAALSAARATKGARVVAVHFDARGAIVGGDVAYIDVPRSPRSVTATVRTTGAAGLVKRVQVFVLAPR